MRRYPCCSWNATRPRLRTRWTRTPLRPAHAVSAPTFSLSNRSLSVDKDTASKVSGPVVVVGRNRHRRCQGLVFVLHGLKPRPALKPYRRSNCRYCCCCHTEEISLFTSRSHRGYFYRLRFFLSTHLPSTAHYRSLYDTDSRAANWSPHEYYVTVAHFLRFIYRLVG